MIPTIINYTVMCTDIKTMVNDKAPAYLFAKAIVHKVWLYFLITLLFR